jgi:hypothetical protein
VHEERCGPFFKEEYVDDDAVLDNPSHQPPIPRLPTLHANALPVNDQATVAATTTATTTIPTTAAQS